MTRRVPVRKKVQCLAHTREGHQCSNWADATIGLCNPVHRPARHKLEEIRARGTTETPEALAAEYQLPEAAVRRILSA